MSDLHNKNGGFIRYVGAKNKLAAKIAPILKDTGAECLVDVFGGSGAVVSRAGFEKRVYNDADGDLVNLFRVMQNELTRRRLLRILKWMPASREVFQKQYEIYRRHGWSFGSIEDPVRRAAYTFFRGAFCFGGKLKDGGFQATWNDRRSVKEIQRYRQILRTFSQWGHFWKGTVLENLDYSDCISVYGQRKGTVLYLDPPYVGTEKYYSVHFSRADAVFLADQLNSCPAPCVVSYYDDPIVRELYPEASWTYHSFDSVKNSRSGRVPKRKTEELVIVKKPA